MDARPVLITVILSPEDDVYIQAKATDFYTDELFGKTHEEAIHNWYVGFFAFLSLAVDDRRVALSDLQHIRVQFAEQH